MKNSSLWQILLIWTALMFFFAPKAPQQTKLSPEQEAAVAALATPATPRLVARPVELANKDLKVSIAPDGSLVSGVVSRYHEDIVERSFTPDEIVKHWKEKQLTSAYPTYSTGLFVAQPPLFIPDQRREHLVASSERLGETGLKVQTSDPEGRTLPKGITVERTYKLHDDGFQIDYDVVLKNTTGDLLDLSKQPPVQIFAGPMFVEGRYPPEAFAFENGALKTLGASVAPSELATGVKYVGVRSSYDALVIEHVAGAGNFIHQSLPYQDPQGKSHTGPVVGFRTKVAFLKKGESETFRFKVFLGLKLEESLTGEYAAIYNNWSGYTGGISKLMFHILQFVAGITGSYGFAILLLTFLVKLLLHPMSSGMLENQQKMQAIQPRIQEIKDRYKDTPEQMNAEMMKLWQEHNYNPALGCLPMFLQIPIFIALYNCLQQAIELKGVGFWWMHDLSKPDQSTILALLFALSIYINGKLMQQRQNTSATAVPAGGDPDMQATMNRMMPIMMYGMFVMMPVPSGVMIYMATQSLLGIAETQYNVYKQKQKKAKRQKASA